MIVSRYKILNRTLDNYPECHNSHKIFLFDHGYKRGQRKWLEDSIIDRVRGGYISEHQLK